MKEIYGRGHKLFPECVRSRHPRISNEVRAEYCNELYRVKLIYMDQMC